MATKSPFLRPLGIAAGILGSFQALAWGVLSLLGILFYTQAIEVTAPTVNSPYFRLVLIAIYFVPIGEGLSHMTPGAVAVWMSLYFATSVIWLVVSGFLIYDFYKSKFTSKLILGWVAVSAVIAVIDFAGTVAFGVDFDRMKGDIDDPKFTHMNKTSALLAPIFMMTIFARGFLLWIINVAFVIYLGVALSKLSEITV